MAEISYMPWTSNKIRILISKSMYRGYILKNLGTLISVIFYDYNFILFEYT